MTPLRPRRTGESAHSAGIYSRLRHPRYVESLLWILSYALFTNYLAMYVAFLLMLPIMHLVVLFEEKELKERFGVEYEEYCRRVPRYIPRVTYGALLQGNKK